MTHKGENYSVKMQKYYFCDGTHNPISHRIKKLLERWKMFFSTNRPLMTGRLYIIMEQQT